MFGRGGEKREALSTVVIQVVGVAPSWFAATPTRAWRGCSRQCSRHPSTFVCINPDCCRGMQHAVVVIVPFVRNNDVRVVASPWETSSLERDEWGGKKRRSGEMCGGVALRMKR